MGESGCGKSTIAAVLTGRVSGYTGHVTIGGQELQIGELSTQSGQVQLSGKIEYLQYAENQQSGGSLLARLFR